eukprot:2615874-Pleurochrysis_carterae.AAC.1
MSTAPSNCVKGPEGRVQLRARVEVARARLAATAMGGAPEPDLEPQPARSVHVRVACRRARLIPASRVFVCATVFASVRECACVRSRSVARRAQGRVVALACAAWSSPMALNCRTFAPVSEDASSQTSAALLKLLKNLVGLLEAFHTHGCDADNNPSQRCATAGLGAFHIRSRWPPETRSHDSEATCKAGTTCVCTTALVPSSARRSRSHACEAV